MAAQRPVPTSGRPREGLRTLLPHLREHRGALAAAAALSLVTAATGLAQPLLVRRVIEAVQDGAPVRAAVVAVVVVLVAGSLVGAV